MKRFLSVVSAGVILSLSIAGSTIAQDDEIEGLASLDDQRSEMPSIPKIRGPITIIRPAALLFATFDKDADYSISRQEAALGTTDAFGRADKNRNGKVSLFELEDWRAAALGSMDALPGNLNFDTDYNNQVSKSEFESALMELFDRHDKNEDGAVKHNELMQILEVPAHKGPEKERQTDRECYDQLQRNRSRY